MIEQADPTVDKKNQARYKKRLAKRNAQRAQGVVPLQDKRNDPTPKKTKPSATKIAERAKHQESRKGLQLFDPKPVAERNPDRPLTDKQMRFAQAWAKGMSIPAAGREAGYADGGSMAYQLAKDPAVLKIVQLEREAYQEACQLTREDVVEGLKKAIDMAELQSEPGTMIAGWRQIGLLCGYYAPQKISVDVNDNSAMARLNRLSDEELVTIIQKGQGRLIEGEVLKDE